MGFHRRTRMVDAKRHAFVYDGGGNATSVVLIDGRVAGVWDVQDHHAAARFLPFVNLNHALEERLGRSWPPWER